MKKQAFEIETALLYAVADDFEDYPTVRDTVTTWGKEAGVTLSLEDFESALHQAIREGLINAYSFAPGTRTPTVVETPERTSLETLWFFPSHRGMELIERMGPRVD